MFDKMQNRLIAALAERAQHVSRTHLNKHHRVATTIIVSQFVPRCAAEVVETTKSLLVETQFYPRGLQVLFWSKQRISLNECDRITEIVENDQSAVHCLL